MRVTAVAHDPGGANAVAATVAALRAVGVIVDAFAKGPAARQFAQLGVACTPVGDDHGAVAAGLQGDLLLAGTSAEDSFELDAMAVARARGLPSVAVIDYWANYRQRFTRGGAPARWPDIITAIDAAAAVSMAADGLPGDRIRVTGQPYFAWLIRGARLPRGARPEGVTRVLFASQPDARELEALTCVAVALERLGGRTQLGVRFHPRQRDRQASLDLLRRGGVAAVVEDRPDTLACLGSYDVVLGISSTILLEAALMGVPAGSVLLGGADDPLATVRGGLIPVLGSSEAVRAFVSAPPLPAPRALFLAAHRGSDQRLATLCRSLASTAAMQRMAS